jgi:DNA-3-methyladenine glycosylase I
MKIKHSNNTHIERCAWARQSADLLHYHDTEWGVPVHDDQHLFEMLILEGLQAGLSWNIILQKRPHYQTAFDQFAPEIIAHYSQNKMDQLLQNANLIRNRLKIQACIQNAQQFLKIQAQYGSFDQFIWQYVNHQPICQHWRTATEVPTQSALSTQLSRDLKKCGFKFIGPIICYSFMQAIGMINDHTINCYRYAEIQAQ